MNDRNLLEFFWNQVETRPAAIALMQKQAGAWIPMTWGALGEKVARFASALEKAGFQPGERLAIFAPNCQEWMIADYGTLSAGLVSVPLYPNLTEDQVRYVADHCEAAAAFVHGQARATKLGKPKTLKTLITLDAKDGMSLDDFLATGSADLKPYVKRKLTPDTLATISYTSGTTANPKGVMLSHRNISAQLTALRSRATRRTSDRVLSYLPLSHITERLNQFRHAESGYVVYFGGGIDTLGEDLKHVRPSLFVGVPRIYEKIQEGILARAAQSGRRAILDKAVTAGKAFLAARDRGSVPLLTRVRHKALARLVGQKVRAGLGLENCGRYYGGAAPLNPETAAFFFSLGMTIAEGYGMTECGGASHLNFLESPKFGTVGSSLDGIECRLAQDGEILLRGGNVFEGYYRDPEATRETIRDGWLHTGDIGALDSGGRLRITDRKKNIIVTSGGKNIAPAPLEARIKQHPDISQAVVIGDRRKYLVAIVTLAAGVSKEKSKPEIRAHLERINATLPSYETIKSFLIFETDFSIETGELTPTLKVKRGFIQEKYKAVIDELYQSSEEGPRAEIARAAD